VAGLVLYSPAGGPAYRQRQHGRFAEHEAFVRENGIAALVALARESDATFAQDPRIGPWASVVTPDLDLDEYLRTASDTGRGLFDRDDAPGPAPEQLQALDNPALVVPGNDQTHATSAAEYLAEHLPRAEYWDVMPDEQTADNAPRRVVEFLQQ
jgi:pimeloyl-ACP methyl ester carboxylesterase